MADEKELVIIQGEEFRLSVRSEINRKDIFYEQYREAAKMLDSIVAVRADEVKTSDERDDKKSRKSDQWCKTEYENNIIAFCGERGEGKSSVMMSFVKAAYEYDGSDGDSIFADCENIKKAYFAEPIVIDPSMLDGVHNVLDIVLATLYQKFKDLYDDNNQLMEAYEREKLLDQFQKVYKSVSLINNQDKMRDDEYDYEGNISKLSRLGQSTGLKDELRKLIRIYMEVMPRAQAGNKNAGNLLIAIDDLDLCSSHAYKMAEQIRKYLIIPHVAIVMAIKVEQLELCVREQNLSNYKNVIQMKEQEEGIVGEVAGMSERYVAKLIPKARRNYLPNVRMMHHVKILYRSRGGKDILDTNLGDSVSEIILRLIYEKTGMMFLPDKSDKNYFLPDNLRDTVNILVLLAGMKEPCGRDGEEGNDKENNNKESNNKKSNDIYYENILKFSDYYEKQWLFGNLTIKECREIQKLVHERAQLHESAAFLLDVCYRLTEKKIYTLPSQFLPETNNSFFRVMNWLEVYQVNVFGEEEKKYAYVFHILYTIRMNELLRRGRYNELIHFMGGYLWAGNFINVLPRVQGSQLDRSRFTLSAIETFNTIAEELYPDKDILLQESSKEQYYVTEIKEEDNDRKKKIIVWLVLGMLSNTYWVNPSYQIVYTFETVPIVFDNHTLLPQLHISLENYLVALCNLESLFQKVNMEYLGIKKAEFMEIVDEIQQSNREMIESFRKIITNADLALQFKEYCSKKKEIKERGVKSALEKSETVVEIFFNNTREFIKDSFQIELKDLEYLSLKYEDSKYEDGKNDDSKNNDGKNEDSKNNDSKNDDSKNEDSMNDGSKTKIDISHIYALLIQKGEKEEDNFRRKEVKDKEGLVKEFAAKLRERSESELPFEKASGYLKTKTAKNAKTQMDSLASNIQRYYSLHGEERLEEAEISELCGFYGKVMDVFLDNPSNDIPEDWLNEYKTIVKKYQKIEQ